MNNLDKAIADIIETYNKLKEINAKIEEKRRLLKESHSINLGDIALLPLIW